MRYLVVGLALFLPAFTQAAVIISEVAWMGSSASANHEWIELYNNGSAVDVSGWTFTDGMNLNIPLAGTIPAQSYAVLERTSDDSAQGTAFLIYTGALVNTGATLQLKRSDGGLEDQVAGGENWQSIGGDNLTKETAQYTTSGWVTGVATPGAANSGTPKDDTDDEEETEEDDSDNDSETPPKLKVSSGEAVQLLLPDMTLKLVVGAQKLGYVNQSIQFKVTPSGVGDTFIDSLSYEWNFGDGTTAVAKEPTHSYRYPGTYVVTVYGGYKRQEQVARHEITVLPVSISLTSSVRGDLQINNDSPYEIDISGYRINGGKEFVFPPRSVLLPKQTITLPADEIGQASRAVLHDSTGARVISKEKPKQADTPTVPTALEKVLPVQRLEVAKKESEKGSAWHTPLLPPESQGTLGEILKNYLSPANAVASEEFLGTSTEKSKTVPQNAWPYLGLIGVIILGLFGTARKLTSNQTE
jgi:PKD domain/Lamin Tail Domain